MPSQRRLLSIQTVERGEQRIIPAGHTAEIKFYSLFDFYHFCVTERRL